MRIEAPMYDADGEAWEIGDYAGAVNRKVIGVALEKGKPMLVVRQDAEKGELSGKLLLLTPFFHRRNPQQDTQEKLDKDIQGAANVCEYFGSARLRCTACVAKRDPKKPCTVMLAEDIAKRQRAICEREKGECASGQTTS